MKTETARTKYNVVLEGPTGSYISTLHTRWTTRGNAIGFARKEQRKVRRGLTVVVYEVHTEGRQEGKRIHP